MIAFVRSGGLRAATPPRSHWVLLLGAVGALSVIVSAVWSLLAMREYELKSAESRMRDVSLLLAQHTMRAVNEVDQILRHAEHDVLEQLQGTRPLAAKALHAAFQDHIRHAPQIRWLLYTDASGDTLVSSLQHPAPAVNYADRDFFTVLRARVVPGLYIAPPVIGRMSGDATLPFARAVRGADGQFLGVVSAAVRPTYFHDIYQLLDLGPGGGARLMQQTGVLMAGGGEAGGSIGENFSHTEAFKAGVANEAGAVLRHRGGADKAMRVSAVRPVRGYPLVVGVSMTQTHVLGHWHTQSRFIAPLAGALTLFLLGLSHFLSRALRTDAQLRHELDRVEERQRFAIEGAGHGVWDWDIPSDSVHRSGGYHRIFGLPETFPAEKHAWRDTVHPDDLPRAREAMVGMAKGDRTQISDEIRVRSPAGGWRHAIIRGTVVARDAAGKPLRVIGTVTDITELRSAQQRLQEGEARLAAIIDSAMDAVITVDANQHIVLFNAAAERFFGLRALDAVGQPLDRLIPERFRQAHGTHIAQFGATGVTTRRMGAKIVLAGLRANGEEFPIDASISQVTVSGQKFFTVILRDITARVAADAEIERSHHDLRELSRAANDALEGERRRVARELHDELGQQLTAMKIDIGELDKMVAAERPDMQERIARLRSLVDQTVASTRRISSDLRPLMLDDLGLGAALEWLVQSFQQRTGIRATLTLDDALAGIDEPHASAIFRIVQESLTNAARHSGANAVTIELAREDDEAIVRVRDNGRGLQEGDRDKRGSFGLLGMRERAKLLGGAATVENHAAGGAVVTARLPFAPLPSEVAAG